MNFLTKLLGKIKTAWKNANMTPEERYLSRSIDLVDYESRLRDILFRNHDNYPPLRGT